MTRQYGDVPDDLRRRVLTERRARGWSVRRAAEETRRPDESGHRPEGITNTTWGRYEGGEVELTPKVQTAIAWAYEWPTNWPDADPVSQLGEDDELHSIRRQALLELEDLRRLAEDHERRLARLEGGSRRRSAGPQSG